MKRKLYFTIKTPKIMKNAVIILLILTTMTSCVEVLFETPQPQDVKSLDSFPETMHGSYLTSNSDTLIIASDEIIDPGAENDSIMKISEDFVLKKYKGYYIISVKHETGMWEVAILEPKGKGAFRLFTFDGENEEKMARVKQFTTIETFLDEEGKPTKYQLNPSKKDFAKLLKADVFEEIGVFNQIE